MTTILLDEQMLTSAVRYALGRATYIVGFTVEQCINVWPELADKTRAVIIRDITEQRGRHLFAFDGDEWERVVENHEKWEAGR